MTRALNMSIEQNYMIDNDYIKSGTSVRCPVDLECETGNRGALADRQHRHRDASRGAHRSANLVGCPVLRAVRHALE